MDYLMIIIVAVMVIEIILSVTWNRLYFSKGVAIFSHNIPLYNVPRGTLSPKALSRQFSSGWAPSFLFRTLSSTEIAFREKMIEFRLFSYTPVMHGLIHFIPERRSIRVVGFINWWIYILAIMAAYISYNMGASSFIFLFGFLGVFGLIYAVQRSRYSKIVDAISETLNSGA